MTDPLILALRLDEEGKHTASVHASLRQGVGRFGWSYVQTADLRDLRRRILSQGWESLTEKEQRCYQEFLLDLKEGDYVVYINVPSYGQCTLARVAGPYFWKWEDTDFNHRFPVDPESVRSFDRNDEAVHPSLRARLKLMGRKWTITAKQEFADLLAALAGGAVQGKRFRPETDKGHLRSALDGMLGDVARKIQATHPNTALERLVMEALKNVPGVVEVEKKAGPRENGADILVTFDEGLPLGGLSRQRRCVVQVKSYEGKHGSTTAVDQIKTALEYHAADIGLIVSSATEKSDDLEHALEVARESTKKPIGLIIGTDFARFILRFGADVIGNGT